MTVDNSVVHTGHMDETERRSKALALIQIALALHGRCDSQSAPRAVRHQDVKRYAAHHPETTYTWWTEKTGPGAHRVAWRLTKEKDA